MKFARVGTERCEAVPGVSAVCPTCGAAMIAKCGERRHHHWAHRSQRDCDRWWEPETEWHRRWKNEFPREWQEFVQHAPNGERHIADVKTEHGWVVEFQHSYLPPLEVRAREAFYRRLVWIVDGTRRKRDQAQFFRALAQGQCASAAPLAWLVSGEKCNLIQQWVQSASRVYFDLGDITEVGGLRFRGLILWRLGRLAQNGPIYLSPVDREQLIEALRTGGRPAGIAINPVLPVRPVGPGPRGEFPANGYRRRRVRSRF